MDRFLQDQTNPSGTLQHLVLNRLCLKRNGHGQLATPLRMKFIGVAKGIRKFEVLTSQSQEIGGPVSMLYRLAKTLYPRPSLSLIIMYVSTLIHFLLVLEI